MALALRVSLNPGNKRTSLRSFATLGHTTFQSGKLRRPLEDEKPISAPAAKEGPWEREPSLMLPKEATPPRRHYQVNGTKGAKKLLSSSPRVTPMGTQLTLNSR